MPDVLGQMAPTVVSLTFTATLDCEDDVLGQRLVEAMRHICVEALADNGINCNGPIPLPCRAVEQWLATQ